MKKVLSLVLVLAMVLGSFSFVSAATPNGDVVGTVYEPAVARLALLGILEGYPDGTFKPENQITRAEFAAVAIRAKGLNATAQAAKGLATGFSDVPAGHWASGYVGTAAKLGIVNGVGNGLFAPEAPVKYEEAITMLVRALGYEAAAQARGGYPYGYLIVANENGLLDAVKGTQGAPATRGIVAQLTDNALEIPMMVQVGFGSEVKWVVSGSKEHGGDERYLLDDMGFDTYEGRVVSVNTKRNEITLDNEDEDLKLKDKTVEVAEGFDFYSVEGLTIKVWYAKDEVVLYTVKDEAKFDAVSYDSKDKEMKLVTEDETYDVAKGAYLELDGDKETKDFKADYAKVVLNDDDEIVWAQGYKLPDLIVVKDFEDEVIEGYGDDELKVKDFTIVKEGKTVAAEDLEDGEVVLYNNSEKFAVVATASTTAKVDRAYTDEFKFDGDTYTTADVKYFDGKNLDTLNEDILKELIDDEDEVEAIFNFNDKMVVLKGEDKGEDASSFYAVLLEESAVTTGRRSEQFLSIDVRTADGAKKAYDLDAKFVKKHGLGSVDAENKITADKIGIKDEGDVIKITVDKDGEPTKIAIPEQAEVRSDFKVTASYAKGKKSGSDVDYKLTPSTVVFYNGMKKAIKIGDIKDEFELIKEGGTIFFEAGKAVAIVADTNADADTKVVVGLLTAFKELRGGGYEFRVKVAGNSETYVTETTDSTLLPENIEEYTIVKLTVGERSNKVVIDKDTDEIAIVELTGANVVENVEVKKASSRTLTVIENTYDKEYGLVNNFKIYDAEDEYAEIKNVRDLEGRKVDLYFDGGSKYYVAYVIATDEVKDGEDTAKFETAFTARGNTWVTIAGEDYLYGGTKTVSKLIEDFGNKDVTFVTKTIDNELVIVDIKLAD